MPRFYFMPQKHSSIDLASLRGKITNLVAQNAIAMVQCAIDGVKEEGQYQAIKYLFEMVGLYPAVSSTDEKPDDSLAALLLQRLGLSDDGAPGSTMKS